MNTVVEVIDCSALVLPGVGGRHHEQPNWVPSTVDRLSRVLAQAQARDLGITVIAEWAGGGNGAGQPAITDLGSYLNANFSGIYGALGLKAPHGLPTGPAVLVPESLGHAVIRYLVRRSASTDIDHGKILLSLTEISRALSDQERDDLLQSATQGHLVLLATHAPGGVMAQGMSPGRRDVQREIDKIILGTLNGW